MDLHASEAFSSATVRKSLAFKSGKPLKKDRMPIHPQRPPSRVDLDCAVKILKIYG